MTWVLLLQFILVQDPQIDGYLTMAGFAAERTCNLSLEAMMDRHADTDNPRIKVIAAGCLPRDVP